MNTRRYVLAVIGLATVSFAAAPRNPLPDLVPTEGAVVPRNSKIWVFNAGFGIEIFDAQNHRVDVTLMSLKGGLERLTPVSELVPGKYEIRSGDGQSSRFTVTDEVDTTPPAVPLAMVNSTNGKVGQWPSTVSVTSPTNHGAFLVVLDPTQTWNETVILQASARGNAIVAGLPAGEARLKVIQVDAAGNASEPVELATTIPADRACSVGPALPLSLLALTLLLRRQRAS